MNDAEKEAEDIVKDCCRQYAILDNSFYLKHKLEQDIREALQKKQDEIEQYKTQWQNAEYANIKLSEKILEYRKEIERLKKEGK